MRLSALQEMWGLGTRLLPKSLIHKQVSHLFTLLNGAFHSVVCLLKLCKQRQRLKTTLECINSPLHTQQASVNTYTKVFLNLKLYITKVIERHQGIKQHTTVVERQELKLIQCTNWQ